MSFAIAAWVALGAALAGFVQGVSGFAFGLVAMGLWAWTLEPALAGPLVVVGAIVGQALAILRLRVRLPAQLLVTTIVAGLVGVPVGVLLLRQFDVATFRIVIGSLLAASSLLMLRAAHGAFQRYAERPATRIGAGFLGGAMAGLSGLCGPPIALWTAASALPKEQQRALMNAFNLMISLAALAVMWAAGLLTAEFPAAAGLVTIVMTIPALLGMALFARLSGESFRRVVLGLVAISGVSLLATGLMR